MGFQSQSGHAIFRTQTTPDTYAADIATAGVAVRLRSGGLGPNRDLLIPDPEIGGNRDDADALLGAISWTGDYEFYSRFKALPTFLYGALGAKASSTTTGVSTHTITPADVLPWLSIEEKIANSFEIMNFWDAKVNTLHLEAEANGYFMGTAGMVARRGTAGNTATASGTVSGLTDTTPLAVGTNIVCTYNGMSLPAKSFSLDINNNLEDDDFRLGSLFLGEITEKHRELTMGFTIRPADSGLWRQAIFGTAAATAAGGVVTQQQAIVTISSYDDIPSGTPATKFSLTITVPKATLMPFNTDRSGDDVIEQDIELKALRPNPATDIASFVVKNGTTAVA